MQKKFELFPTTCKVYSANLFGCLLESWGKKKRNNCKNSVDALTGQSNTKTNKPATSPSQNPNSTAVGSRHENSQSQKLTIDHYRFRLCLEQNSLAQSASSQGFRESRKPLCNTAEQASTTAVRFGSFMDRQSQTISK